MLELVLVLNMIMSIKQQVINMNGKYQRNKHQKSNILFQWHDKYWSLWFKLTKNRQNVIQKHWYLQHWIHHNKKIDDYHDIYSVNPLYLIISKVDGFIEEKNESK